MKIDVVLPTYNRADIVRAGIDSFLAAAQPAGCSTRLIIVNNNSTDSTEEMALSYVARHPDLIHYLFEPQPGKFHALNAGIAFSDADVIGFFDDDERLDPEWLRVIERNFRDEAVGYLGGECRADWQSAPPPWLPSRYNGVLALVNHGPHRRRYGEPQFDHMLSGGNAAMRRSVLLQCGPYRGHLLNAEDRYMHDQLKRVGAIGYYDPDLVVLHRVPASRLTKSYYRYWAFNEGRTTAKVDRESSMEGKRILGIPRWMIGRALRNVATVCFLLGPTQRGRRFQSQLQLVELWGYLTVRLLRTGDWHAEQDRTRLSV